MQIQCDDPPLFLGRLGELLGLPANTTIKVNTTTVSPGKIEINHGLRYIYMCCIIVGRTSVIDPHGKRSSVVSTLPVTADGSLKGTVVHYKDIESKMSISNKFRLNVRASNGSKFAGSVLLYLYIM